ncbi:D-glycero-alpha-D-manno-heptose-1,7-bisphosphate 7-phosphatase [Rufibacter glacialis]|uniref:D,D-heptose 1,7-bisphosphate phosphatase n=1 Tax=Rufibacter glacialis TaxID=1259555 RepID=A0A5M8QB53_9BACT|nr:HAD family hydrolase [Rufibacter glacialis]KAA6432388.1 HAD family hydrolase [Rufibacter glacialis]GGK78250.1 hypothetical protein GCM10011405_27600 [Rufibacter glacialis]
MSFPKLFDTLFLDRDGVINLKIENGYVTNFSAIEILPGISEFLAAAQEKFERIIVVTNQRCVGRGIISTDDLIQINNKINELTGNLITQFFFCPHLEEDGCTCRKPKEGLFLKAADTFKIDFSSSWMVGDSETDLIPAKKLGLKTVFIGGISEFADVKVDNTLELLSFFAHMYTSEVLPSN